jgi:hypothetical protein
MANARAVPTAVATVSARIADDESFSGDGLIAAYFGREALQWKEPPISRNRYSTSLFGNPLYDLAEKLPPSAGI